MRNSAWWTCWVSMGACLAAGCEFSVDPTLVKPLDAPTDGGALDGAYGPADGGNQDDGESSTAEQVDGGAVGIDADLAPSRDGSIEPACREDSDCSASQYCSKVAGDCLERCDTEKGCAGPLVEGRVHLVNDHSSLFWSTESSGRDLLSAPIPDGSLWSWDLSSEPRQVASGLKDPVPVIVADGYLYYREDTRFSRVSLRNAAAPEPVADDARHLWATQEHVYWSVTKPGSSSELWRRSRSTEGEPLLLRTGEHFGWVGGNDDVALRFDQREGPSPNLYVLADSISNAESSQELRGPLYGWSSDVTVDGTIVYMQEPESRGWVEAFDLGTPDSVRNMSPSPAEEVHFIARDGWLYWAYGVWDDQTRRGYGRSRWDELAEPVEALRRRPAQGNFNNEVLAFAVLGSELVYHDAWEGRLFVKRAPLPCGEQLTCPALLACSETSVCE